jgi:predicted site-specific integrase-resolvase
MQKNQDRPRKLANLSEAARELGLDVATVKRAAELGQLRIVELGSRRYILRKEISRLTGEGDGE